MLKKNVFRDSSTQEDRVARWWQREVTGLLLKSRLNERKAEDLEWTGSFEAKSKVVALSDDWLWNRAISSIRLLREHYSNTWVKYQIPNPARPSAESFPLFPTISAVISIRARHVARLSYIVNIVPGSSRPRSRSSALIGDPLNQAPARSHNRNLMSWALDQALKTYLPY